MSSPDPHEPGTGMTYFEDISAGDEHDCGSRTVTRDEIISFAESFDPQPKHVDETVAETTQFGGLIASGWHTASLCMRLLVDNVLSGWQTVAAKRVEVEWTEAVRPNDTLSVTLLVEDTYPSKSSPDIGYVDMRLRAYNQQATKVLEWTSTSLVETQGEQ
jgi:acyl dehydratase